MTLKTSVIIVVLIVLILLTSNFAATAASEEIAHMNKIDRQTINPDFDPDESCLFNVFQLKCVPGSQQECPEGFGLNIPDNCVPHIGKNGNWECPKDYHSVEADETAQCYPNSKPCPEGTTLVPRGGYDGCAEMVVGVLPLVGVISKDPVNGECIQGYDLTKDAKKCVRAQEVDCNSEPDSSLCTGESGRYGSLFCDEYAQLTGSRIAYGGYYDRNDNPRSYCDDYAIEEAKKGLGWFCESVCNNYKEIMAKREGCDNFMRCEDSPAPRFCVNKETFCSINDLSRKINRDYCFSDEDDCLPHLDGSRCKSN